MNVMLIIYIVCSLVSAVMISPKLMQLLCARHLPERKIAQDKRKIALVIPARNESEIIPDLLDSIDKQTYDRNFFSVNVIVKDKNDPTVELASQRGANVFVVPDQKCKGDALDGFFRQASIADADAYAIIDADAVLSPDYVQELNNALEFDKDIFSTKKMVKNYLGDKRQRSLVCNCSALIYPMIDECGNLYRAEKNMPISFIGQGLMIRREIIEKLGGWPYRTLTEDYELKMDSFIKGFSSMYYPYAVLYTEEAVSYKESRKRRLRWVTGYAQCDKNYKSDIRTKIKSGDFDFAVKYDYLYFKYPIFMYLFAASLAQFYGLYLFVSNFGTPLSVRALALLVLMPMCITYIILFMYGALLMINNETARKSISKAEKLFALIAFPFYILDFVPIYIESAYSVFRHKPTDWKETERLKRADK